MGWGDPFNLKQTHLLPFLVDLCPVKRCVQIDNLLKVFLCGELRS